MYKQSFLKNFFSYFKRGLTYDKYLIVLKKFGSKKDNRLLNI